MKLLCPSPQALNEDECREIVDAAVRIASRVPLRVTGASPGGRDRTYTDQLLAMLREIGCEISDDGTRVSFPSEVIARVMERIAGHRAAAGEPSEPG